MEEWQRQAKKALAAAWPLFLERWDKATAISTNDDQTPRLIDALEELLARLPMSSLQAESEEETLKRKRDLLSILNLALYLTRPHDDVNRDWVSWLKKEKKEGYVLTSAAGNILIKRWGLVFEGESIVRAPLSHKSLYDPMNLPSVDSRKIAALHACQLDVFLLTDHWEHNNILLAHDQLHVQSRLKDSSDYQNQLETVFNEREWLIEWTTRSLEGIESWLRKWRQVPDSHEDVDKEWKATHVLCLAAMQKLLLPASISRQIYKNPARDAIVNWYESRARTTPDDAASAFVFAVFSAVYSEDLSPLSQILQIFAMDCEQQFFERTTWSHDPSTALKAFCWSWDSTFHFFLAALYFNLVYPKSHLLGVQNETLLSVWELLRMPSTFPMRNALKKNMQELMAQRSFLQNVVTVVEKAARFLEGESSPLAKELCQFFRESLETQIKPRLT